MSVSGLSLRASSVPRRSKFCLSKFNIWIGLSIRLGCVSNGVWALQVAMPSRITPDEAMDRHADLKA
jgi:hypothetical protein